jgi:hypothetical protein
MAIQKRFIHFKKFSDFNSKKLSANEANTKYTVGISGAIQDGTPDVLYESYVWIKDTKQQWTHGQLYDGNTVNLSDYQTKEEIEELYAKNDALILRNISAEDFGGSVDEISTTSKTIILTDVVLTFDTLQANTTYVAVNSINELTINNINPTSYVEEYIILFKSGDGNFILNLPDTIYWGNGMSVEVEPNTHYELSINAVRIDNTIIPRCVLIPFKTPEQ